MRRPNISTSPIVHNGRPVADSSSRPSLRPKLGGVHWIGYAASAAVRSHAQFGNLEFGIGNRDLLVFSGMIDTRAAGAPGRGRATLSVRRPAMRRIDRIALACASAILGGCQAAGQYPGIAPSFYAYTVFNGQVSEVFQFPPHFVETSCMQALADLGFTAIEKSNDGPVVVITATTPDGCRPARMRIEPQNAMTMFRIRIGRGVLGDEPLSKSVIDRIALNYGAVPRTLIPIEPTLGRRGPINIPAAPPTPWFEPIAPLGVPGPGTVIVPAAPLGPITTPPVPVGPSLPPTPNPPANVPNAPVPADGDGPFAQPSGSSHRAEMVPAPPAARPG
jgi:hypothetical protein